MALDLPHRLRYRINMAVDQLMNEALKLPLEQREVFALSLLDSVYQSEQNGGSDEWRVAWASELKRRMAEVDNGTAVLIAADDALQLLDEAIAEAACD